MDSEQAGRYKMGTLSRMTGLKPELLRAWQRRFGLFEPRRTEGGHRLYTPDDLRLALHLRDLVDSGRSIGELASRGRAALLAEAIRGAPTPGPSPQAPPPVPAVEEDGVDVAAIVAQIVRGAVSIDAARVGDALDRGLRGLPLERFLQDVVKPASVEIGDLWERGACSVAGEHLASALIRERLASALSDAGPPEGGTAPEVVVACAPDDYHENGALVVAVRLATLGWRVTWLGGATPAADLDQTCRLRRPHAVYISCTLPGCFTGSRDALLAFARRWQGAFQIVVGGQGAPEHDAAFAEAGARISPRWLPPAPA